MSNVLVIVPHGDDEVLGFGGTIHKHVKNEDFVYVCFLRKAYDRRSQAQTVQTIDAKNILRYYDHTNLDLLPVDFTELNVNTLSRIENYLCKINPDILYLPHEGDVHQDHKMTHEYIRIATRIHGPAPISKIYAGEILSSTYNSFACNFLPNHFVHLTLDDIEVKQKALKCYTNEIQLFPHPRSEEGIMVQAKSRGMESGSLYAEAYITLRSIDK